MILAALILGLCIIAASVYKTRTSEKFNVKPRHAFAQVAVIGRTEDSETMQITATLFHDEDVSSWDAKLKTVYELRESRLKFQNERLLKMQEEAEAVRKEAEAALKDGSLKMVKTKG